MARTRVRLIQRFRWLRIVGARGYFHQQTMPGGTMAIDGRKQRGRKNQSAMTATRKETDQ